MLSFIQEHWAEANNFWTLRNPLRLLWALRNPVSLLWTFRDSVSLPWALRDLLRLFWAPRDPVSLPWALRNLLDCPGLSEISMRSPELHWTSMSMKDGPAAQEAQCGPGIPGWSVLKCWCYLCWFIYILSNSVISNYVFQLSC